MSRAAWVGLLLLGAGFGLVAFLLTRGLPDEAKAQAQLIEARLDTANKEVATARELVNTVVALDKAYLSKQPEVAEVQRTLEAREAALKAIETQIRDGELAKLIKKDAYGDRGAVWQLTFDLGKKLDGAAVGLSSVDAPVRRLLHYKTHHQELLTQARGQLDGLAAYAQDLTLASQVASAESECPNESETLQKLAKGIQDKAAALVARRPALDAAAAAQPLDYAQVGRLAEGIVKEAEAVRTARSSFLADLGTLTNSRDEILADMKEDGALRYHKYQVIEGGTSKLGSWQVVPRATYDAHRDHLGMTIYSKPECVLASQAVKVASPPGYSYIGNPRYGSWETRNGQSFWVFYGRYALMRDLFWGRSYQPIGRSTYSTYRSSVRSGKAWYGSKREYGTQGSTTRTKYSSSTYYKRSAARAASRSTGYSNSRYSGSGSSGSSTRSGGYRSSRSRSSSFGGGGK